MQWFDWMTAGIILAVAIVEFVRARTSGGFGQVLFDAIALIIAALGSTWLAQPLGSVIGGERWLLTLILFAVLSIGVLIISRVLFSFTEWSSDSFDSLLSILFGIACGWIIANMVLRIIILKQGDLGPVNAMMANAPIAREVFQFRLWNSLIEWFSNLNLGPEVDY